jgi:hypothetical protein
VLAATGAPHARTDADGFVPGSGFYTGFTCASIAALAAETRYRVARCEHWPYLHAVLAPDA